MKETTRVLKNRFMIGAVAVTAAAVPFAGMALTAGPAGAAKTPKGITCSTGTGKGTVKSASATIALGTCTGNTGTKGTTTGAQGATTGTINWANGKKTSFTESTGSGVACPAGTLDELITGAVTTDNTKSTGAGAAVSGEFCVTLNSAGTKFKLKLAPGTQFTIAP
jgi:hypothetical protein